MDAKTKAMLDLLATQRNQALDAFCVASGEVATRDEKIAKLQAELDALKAAQPAE